MNRSIFAAFAGILLCASGLAGQGAAASAPDVEALVGRAESELASVVDRFNTDLSSIRRRYDATSSPDQRRRMREFFSAWQAQLRQLNFDRLSREGKIDYVLLDNYLRHQLDLLARQDTQRTETTALLPFADRLLSLQDA